MPWCIYLSAHFIWRVYYWFGAEVTSIWLLILVPACTFLLPFCRQWKNITFPYGEVCAGVCCQAASGCDDSFEAAGHGFVVWVVVLFTYRCSLTFVGLQNFGIKQVYNLEPIFIYNLCFGIVWCRGRVNSFAFSTLAPRRCKLVNPEHRNCISCSDLRNNAQCLRWVFCICNITLLSKAHGTAFRYRFICWPCL